MQGNLKLFTHHSWRLELYCRHTEADEVFCLAHNIGGSHHTWALFEGKVETVLLIGLSKR